MPTTGSSIETIEAFVKSALPKSTHDHMIVQGAYWNRGQGNYNNRTDIYQAFEVSACGWGSIIDQNRKSFRRDEGGICALMMDPFYGDSTKVYLPMIDFLPLFGRGSRDEDAFWADLEQLHPGKRFYVFKSGNASHGFLAKLLDQSDHNYWYGLCSSHPTIVDPGWTKMIGNQAGGVLRTTAGKANRPVPYLTRWVNL